MGSLITNPVVSSLLDTQLANLSYLIRDSLRVSGESLKLPQAVPDNRKMDYQFRHFHAVFYMSYLMELSFRLADKYFTAPHLIDKLELGKLNQLYAPGSIHRPPGLTSLKGVNDLTVQRFPASIADKFFGTIINPRSYEYAADLLEHELKTGQVLPEDRQTARLLVHHFRRTLTPDKYLTSFVKEQVSPQEFEFIQKHYTKFDQWKSQLEGAAKSLSAKDALAYVKKRSPGSPLLKLAEEEFDLAFKGGLGVMDHVSAILTKGPVGWWKNYRLVAKMAQDPVLKLARKQTRPGLVKLFETVQSLRTQVGSATVSPATQRLLGVKSINELEHLLGGGSFSEMLKQVFTKGPRYAYERYSKANLVGKADYLLDALRKDILLPGMQTEGKSFTAKALAYAEDLTLRKLNHFRLSFVPKMANFYVKIPVSMVLLFLGYGLISNFIDNKILQPYQKKLSKERGDAREFLMPGYVGAIPAVLTFLGLMRLPFIKRLGYVSSFGVSGAAGLAAYAATTYALFKARISRPRTLPVRANNDNVGWVKRKQPKFSGLAAPASNAKVPQRISHQA